MHLRVNCQFKFWLLSCLKREIILHEWKRWIHYAAQWVTNKECEVKYLTKYLHCPFNDPYKHLLTDSKISTSFWAILPYLLMEVMKVTVSMFYFPFMLAICHLNDINLKKKNNQEWHTHTVWKRTIAIVVDITKKMSKTLYFYSSNWRSKVIVYPSKSTDGSRPTPVWTANMN